MNTTAWQGFQTGKWTNEIDVRNFIQKNYTLYEGDDTFLEGVTERTQKVWDKCHELILEEMKKGILDVETNIVSVSYTHLINHWRIFWVSLAKQWRSLM